jgi:3D (Asp-Asp-Asp) domain-containing protein
MKKSILTFAAAAAITGSLGIHASAQDVKVKDGDTLWGLSQKYEVSVNELKSLNKLSNDIIQPKQILKVSNEEYYTIKKGDTLWNIADHYRVSVESLKEWNKLKTDIIHPSQKLLILEDGRKAVQVVKAENNFSEKAAEGEQSKPVAAKKAATVEKAEPKKKVNTAQSAPDAAKEITVRATGYTASCEGCSGVTATGVDLKANPDAKVISVDPSVIPLGSKVYVEGYGYATAADTGGAIKGNRIDIFFADKKDAVNWGVKEVSVKILK